MAAFAALTVATTVVPVTTAQATQQTLAGFDISESQGVPDMAAAKAAGAVFAFVKDTAGTGYVNPNFLAQFRAAKDAGLIRGLYHYARPDGGSGADQARYLHDHDGKWYADGMSLPPVLDVEDTQGAAPCYGLTPDAMVAWITDFSTTLRALVGHVPIIYTSTRWWKACTGNSTVFSGSHVLWLARYAPDPGELPGGWSLGFWQSATTGPLPGDQDTYFGTLTQLKGLTTG
ncbi:hypothetical protein GCM10017566_25910 [Amycolatopsis bartoniae]|uniref:lysozyme n=1 Tax=Amycolatopsis bartoniae TaxID=941986 RepID=A0A8H9IZL4_9PSEU|nr:hypothetical protein GCM10017566_25910 [Amycolatopsis bartoniae]